MKKLLLGAVLFGAVQIDAGLEKFKDYFDKKVKQVETKFDIVVKDLKKTAVKVGEKVEEKAKRFEEAFKEKSVEFVEKVSGLAASESGFSIDEFTKGVALINKDLGNLTKAKDVLNDEVTKLQLQIKPILDLAAQSKTEALAIKDIIIGTGKTSIESSKIYADVVASLVKKGLGYDGKDQGVTRLLNNYDKMVVMLAAVNFAPVTEAVNGVFDTLNQLLSRVANIWQSMGDLGKQFESVEVYNGLTALKNDIAKLKTYSNNLLNQKFFAISLRSQELIRVLVIGMFQDVKQAAQTTFTTNALPEMKIAEALTGIKRDLTTINTLAPMVKGFLDNSKAKFAAFSAKAKTAKTDWLDRVKKEIAANPLKNAILAPKIAINQLKVTFDSLRKDLTEVVKSLNPLGLAMAELSSDGSQIIYAVDQWVGTGKLIQAGALKNVEGWFGAVTAIINDLNKVIRNIELVFARE